METEKEKETQKISVGVYSITFGDLSNLDALINELSDKTSKLNLEFEHLSEIKKIIKKVRNSTK